LIECEYVEIGERFDVVIKVGLERNFIVRYNDLGLAWKSAVLMAAYCLHRQNKSLSTAYYNTVEACLRLVAEQEY
jgi:hypothetical protein